MSSAPVPHLARLSRRCLLALMVVLCGPVGAWAQLAPMSVPDLPAVIPLFPLPNVAVLPFQELPLRVFEPRYREMLTDALAGDRVIGIVQIQPGFEAEYEGRPPVFRIGCAAVIVRADRGPGGDSEIVVRGFTKFAISEEQPGRPYRLARVSQVPEFPTDEDREQLRRERPALEAAFAASLGVPAGALRMPAMSDEDFVSTLVMTLDLETLDRQLLIEKDGVLARARALLELLMNRRPPARR